MGFLFNFFWLTVSKPDRKQWHNVCFTQLVTYGVPTLCDSILLLHADYLSLPPRVTSWVSKDKQFTFIWDVAKQSVRKCSQWTLCQQDCVCSEQLLESYSKHTLVLEGYPDAPLCWVTLPAHWKFKDVNSYFFWFWFFFFIVIHLYSQRGG